MNLVQCGSMSHLSINHLFGFSCYFNTVLVELSHTFIHRDRDFLNNILIDS